MDPAPKCKFWVGGLASILVLGVTGCGNSSSMSDTSTSTRFDRQAYAEEALTFQKAEAECLTELGFPASIQPEDRGLTPMKVEHNGRIEEMREARENCAERLGGRPTAPPPDAEELGKFYDLEIEAYECLVAHGYTPDLPPSRETYVSSYFAEAGGPWSAHRIDGKFLPVTECPEARPENIEW